MNPKSPAQRKEIFAKEKTAGPSDSTRPPLSIVAFKAPANGVANIPGAPTFAKGKNAGKSMVLARPV